MKKTIISVTVLLVTALFLMACSDDTEQNNASDKTVDSQTEDKQNNAEKNNDENKKENKSDTTSNSEEAETDNNNSEATSSNNGDTDNSDNQSKNKKDKALSAYSSEEIEFARVWLQLGEVKDVDELNVTHITAGEPLNPNDETSLNYPENVVHLAGSRLIDGSVTYSSNGDGTIILYKKVPQRWDGKKPAGEDAYRQIIEDTEQVYIDTGDDKKIIELIKKINILN